MGPDVVRSRLRHHAAFRLRADGATALHEEAVRLRRLTPNGAAADLLLSYLIIFLTGAATLALELLSSRVLTPYFGVSLYIWSSILSITLTFLAVGYYGGGWLAGRTDSAQRHFFFF